MPVFWRLRHALARLTTLRRVARKFRVHLIPLRFSEADHSNWGQVVNRARAGDVGALSQVGYPGDVTKHAVCRRVLEFAGAGKKGKDIIRHPQSNETLEHSNNEMPAAHTRIEALDFLCRLRPTIERACGRSPALPLHPAHITDQRLSVNYPQRRRSMRQDRRGEDLLFTAGAASDRA